MCNGCTATESSMLVNEGCGRYCNLWTWLCSLWSRTINASPCSKFFSSLAVEKAHLVHNYHGNSILKQSFAHQVKTWHYQRATWRDIRAKTSIYWSWAKEAFGGGTSKDFREALSSFFHLFFLTARLNSSRSLLLWLFESLSRTWTWVTFEHKDLLSRSYMGALLLDRIDGAVARPEFVADEWLWIWVMGRRLSLWPACMQPLCLFWLKQQKSLGAGLGQVIEWAEED